MVNALLIKQDYMVLKALSNNNSRVDLTLGKFFQVFEVFNHSEFWNVFLEISLIYLYIGSLLYQEEELWEDFFGFWLVLLLLLLLLRSGGGCFYLRSILQFDNVWVLKFSKLVKRNEGFLVDSCGLGDLLRVLMDNDVKGISVVIFGHLQDSAFNFVLSISGIDQIWELINWIDIDFIVCEHDTYLSFVFSQIKSEDLGNWSSFKLRMLVLLLNDIILRNIFAMSHQNCSPFEHHYLEVHKDIH